MTASGAKPHNRNALKHGFYADHFSPEELLKFKKKKDLGSEINLARMTADRIFARLSENGLAPGQSGALDEDTLHALNTLSAILTNIGSLARSHQIVSGKYMPTETAILDALHALNIEDGFDNV